MAREVIWSSTAEADIEDIGTDLEKVASHAVAQSVITAIRAATLRLADFPHSARVIPEFQDLERRETFVYDWRLMYRVEHDHIRILRVVHGKRLLKNISGSFEEMTQEAYSAA